ncbi:MAG TPA: DciA family protein [Usitatibacter sp.]|nr:DciA family protein [Usitatibacter sp.]
MAPEPIARLLGDSTELKPLAARLAFIRRLQRRYRTLAPAPLAEASRVCAIDGTTVVICAASGPVAAVLRQLAPRLLEGLRETARRSPKHSVDQELNSIRIEVQVNRVTAPRAVRPRGELPSEKLETVARGLADSPLKEALQRISGRRR